MNWVTTNLRLPEDNYMELKLTAARQRTSLNALIRNRLGITIQPANKGNFWHLIDQYAKTVSRKHPGISFSQKLIADRYEQ